jgi:hypothetical protein
MKFNFVLIGAMCITVAIQQIGCYTQPTIMTREQAAQIASQFVQVGNYPGTLHWLTTQDLPTKQEVDEGNFALIDQLAEQGFDWSITKKKGIAGWFGNGGAYKDTYIFLVTFSQFPDKTTTITVNAWTGYCELEPFREIGETNEQLGLGGFPIKTIDELRNIALNIAQQLLGPGSYDVLTVPYTPDKQQFLADYFWGFIIFKIDPKTGAHLPQMVELFLNSRTGWLECGRFWKRPVNVSTVPNLSKDEAKKKATQALAQLGITVTGWLDDGFYGGQIFNKDAFPYNAVVGLYVIEDDLLRQFLRWIFIFTYTDSSGQKRYDFISVDAHTGAVVFSANLSVELSHQQVRKKQQEISSGKAKQKESEIRRMPNTLEELIQIEEDFWKKYRIRIVPGMYINGEGVHLEEPMLLFNGRLYIEVGYAANPECFGTRWDEKTKKLRGKYGEVVIKPSEQLKYHEQWKQYLLRGRLYIPLRRICEVAGIRLEWNHKEKVPMLWAEWLKPKPGQYQK